MATSHLHISRYQHEQRVTVASWIAVLFIATAWMWIHHTASAGPRDAPLDAQVEPAPSMPGWLAQSQPLVDGLVVARNNIAAAAAQRDLSATGAACQTANSAVESLHQQMPSPNRRSPTRCSTSSAATASGYATAFRRRKPGTAKASRKRSAISPTGTTPCGSPPTCSAANPSVRVC